MRKRSTRILSTLDVTWAPVVDKMDLLLPKSQTNMTWVSLNLVVMRSMKGDQLSLIKDYKNIEHIGWNVKPCCWPDGFAKLPKSQTPMTSVSCRKRIEKDCKESKNFSEKKIFLQLQVLNNPPLSQLTCINRFIHSTRSQDLNIKINQTYIQKSRRSLESN